MFSSGVASVAVLLKQNPYNTIEQQLEVSLLKISNSTALRRAEIHAIIEENN